jgi:TolB-like protein
MVMRELDQGRVADPLLSIPRLSDALLAGYDDLSPSFQEWMVNARHGLRDRLMGKLEAGYGDAGAPRALRRRMAQAAFMLDPLNEAACRAVMTLAAQDGEIGAALRAYAGLYDALGDELDMEPSAPTRDLVARIKQGAYDATVPSDARPAARPRSPGSVFGAPTVAVLPFRIIGPDPVPSFFSDGVVEDIVCMLATLREPVVISSNSTRAMAVDAMSADQLGRMLGAQYIVSGTVRSADRQLRLIVDLVDIESGAVLWAKAYDTEEPRQLKTQDDIAGHIARTLVPQMRDAELRRSRSQRPEDLSVYHLMLQARELVFRLDRQAFERAGDMLRRAVEIPGP